MAKSRQPKTAPIPDQIRDSQSEFSVNEGLKEPAPEPQRVQQQQQSGSDEPRQDSSVSSESEFSVDERLNNPE